MRRAPTVENGPEHSEHIPEADSAAQKRVAVWVILIFAVLGAFLGPLVAPGIPTWRSWVAGAMLGAFSGGAAVLNRLLD